MRCEGGEPGPFVVEGLRHLPWVGWYRDELKSDGDPMAQEYANCEKCKIRCSRRVRASWGCGWLPESERYGVLRHRDSPEATICVGYTTRMPRVLEAARALVWRNDGVLRDMYDGEPLTDVLRNSLDIMAAEVRRVEKYALRSDDA